MEVQLTKKPEINGYPISYKNRSATKLQLTPKIVYKSIQFLPFKLFCIEKVILIILLTLKMLKRIFYELAYQFWIVAIKFHQKFDKGTCNCASFHSPISSCNCFIFATSPIRNIMSFFDKVEGSLSNVSQCGK